MRRRRQAAAPYPRLRVWLRDPTEEGIEHQPGPPIETIHWAVEELEYTRLAWEDHAGACAVAPISRLGEAFALIAVPAATGDAGGGAVLAGVAAHTDGDRGTWAADS